MPVTKGFEQLSPAEIAAEFMGLPEEKGSGERKKDTQTKEKPKPKLKPKADEEDDDEESESDDEEEDEESDADEEDDDEESESDEEEQDEESEDDDEESESDDEEEDEESEADEEDDDEESESDEEEEDAFKGKKGLRKRFNQLLKENPKLKREVKTLREQLDALGQAPNAVLAPNALNPLSTAKTEAEVESLAAEKLANARAKLRWLNRHQDGGTWAEGTDQERKMSADDVDAAIEHYENLTSSLEKAKTDRKAWLKTYGETAKALGAESVSDLTRPKVANRESELFKQVPELMREPSFLQVLADAKAGRELREKKGKGIKFVEVKPPAKKGKEGKPAKSAKPEQRSKPREEKPREAKPAAGKLTARQLDQLRNSAQSGDRQSQAAIDAAFLG